MAPFKGYIQSVGSNAAPLPPSMPLTHVAGWEIFQEILQSGKLVPQKDSLFQKDLVYFFYGKAAYRPKEDPTQSRYLVDLDQLPACILLDGGRLQGRVGQVPFDTGGFFYGLLDPPLAGNNLTALSDYELHGDHDCLRRCVWAFYESNDGYFEERPRVSLLFPSGSDPVARYYELIQTKRSDKFDDRGKTFEIRFDQEIPLNDQTVMKIVIPKGWIDDKNISSLLVDLGIRKKVVYYIPYMGTFEEHLAVMRERVTGVLREGGMLSKEDAF
ncbi:MAG: hypothetical protein HQL07_09900 [Nitrospirae bacterium]|nr:hypothetical protein [Magnetococcales bacterium]